MQENVEHTRRKMATYADFRSISPIKCCFGIQADLTIWLIEPNLAVNLKEPHPI
jgi:hypothetical protein